MFKKVPDLIWIIAIVVVVFFILSFAYRAEYGVDIANPEIKVKEVPTLTSDLRVYILNDTKNDKEYIVVKDITRGVSIISRDEYESLYEVEER